MANIPVLEGNPPTGYSFVLSDEKPMKPMLWYANAVKVSKVTKKPLREYVITHNRGRYTLWVKKPKNNRVNARWSDVDPVVRGKK
jgi:hypothetical protein